MADMNVTFGEMNDAASKLTTGQTNIETELQTLKSVIDNLVSGGFVTDSASGAFQTAYDEFNTGVNNVITGLTSMSSYLNKAAQTYQDADQQLAKALQS